MSEWMTAPPDPAATLWGTPQRQKFRRGRGKMTPEQRAQWARISGEAHDRHTALVEACEKLLLSLNCTAIRFRSGLAEYTKDGKQFKIPYGVPGWPDLDGTIVPTGARICIECKTGSGGLSKNQRRVTNDLTAAGCLVFVVHDQVDTETAETIRAAVQEVRAMWRWAEDEKKRRQACQANAASSPPSGSATKASATKCRSSTATAAR